MMTQDTKLIILPRSKEGIPDQRFLASAQRIINELGADTINDLQSFARETDLIQRKAASVGLKLAVAIFSEAQYLDIHHRFDIDNQYGWRSKLLRKQARQILENLGFKLKNAHKLVACASWLSSQFFDKQERAWLDSLTPSHIYELSRMNREGYELVKREVSYPEFGFPAGQKDISVKRLEELRRLNPNVATELKRERKKETTQSLKTVEVDSVPDISDTSTAIPTTDPIQDGIKMLLTSLNLIGSIDELAMSNHYLDQLKPYRMTIEMLSDVLNAQPALTWRR